MSQNISVPNGRSNIQEIKTAKRTNGQVKRPASPAKVFWYPKHDAQHKLQMAWVKSETSEMKHQK
jgi:hypothetical protein